MIDFLSSIFANSSNDNGNGTGYGNDSSAPAGVWYGADPYNGPGPSDTGPNASPASQPYEGGPVWVSKWVDTTNPDNCVITGEDGQLGLSPEGCESGYWESVEIPDSSFDSLDTFTGDEDENDEGDNNTSAGGTTAHIPSQIILDNGKVVQVIFGSTLDASADQEINIKVINTLKQALNIASQTVTINSIYIKATTNGNHAITSNHYKKLAVDISRINGTPLVVQGGSVLVQALQNALDNSSNIRENFGPAFKHKLGQPWNVGGHGDHIHFSVNN